MPAPQDTQQMYEELAEHCFHGTIRKSATSFWFWPPIPRLPITASPRQNGCAGVCSQPNPHTLLRPFASFAEALKSSDIREYVADLRHQFPIETATKLLIDMRLGGSVPSEHDLGEAPATAAAAAEMFDLFASSPAPARAGSVSDGPASLRAGSVSDGPASPRAGSVSDGPASPRAGSVSDGPASRPALAPKPPIKTIPIVPAADEAPPKNRGKRLQEDADDKSARAPERAKQRSEKRRKKKGQGAIGRMFVSFLAVVFVLLTLALLGYVFVRPFLQNR